MVGSKYNILGLDDNSQCLNSETLARCRASPRSIIGHSFSSENIARYDISSCSERWGSIQKDLDYIMQEDELVEINKQLIILNNKLYDVIKEGNIDFRKRSSIVDSMPQTKSTAGAVVLYDLINDEIKHLKGKRFRFLIQRNIRITEAYKSIAENNPENRWAKLASYTSSQVGCALKETKSHLSQTAGVLFGVASGAEAALSMGNKTIFSSIGPPFMFISKYGYRQFFKCVGKGGVQKEVVDAVREMEKGNLNSAAQKIASYEQEFVVQPVYDKYDSVFTKIDFLDTHELLLLPLGSSRDRQSIALEYECETGEKILLGNLELKNKEDRVKYYEKLMKALDRKEKAR